MEGFLITQTEEGRWFLRRVDLGPHMSHFIKSRYAIQGSLDEEEILGRLSKRPVTIETLDLCYPIISRMCEQSREAAKKTEEHLKSGEPLPSPDFYFSSNHLYSRYGGD